MVQGMGLTNGRSALDSQSFGLGHDHTFNFDPTFGFGNFNHNGRAETTAGHGSYGSLAPSSLQPQNTNNSLFDDNWNALPSGNASNSTRTNSQVSRNDNYPLALNGYTFNDRPQNSWASQQPHSQVFQPYSGSASWQGVPSAPYDSYYPNIHHPSPLQHDAVNTSLLPASNVNGNEILQTGSDPNLTTSTNSHPSRKRAAPLTYQVAVEGDKGFRTNGEYYEDEDDSDDEGSFHRSDVSNLFILIEPEVLPSPSPRPRPSKYRRTSKRDIQRRHQPSKPVHQRAPQQQATRQQRYIGPRTTNVIPTYGTGDPGKGFDGKLKHWCRYNDRGSFQVGKYAVGPWRHAIRHDDLRPLLYNQARAQGAFRYPREAGSLPGDLTSFNTHQKDWSFDPNKRHRWPKVLFQFHKNLTKQWLPRNLTESPDEWKWNNRLVVDRDNKPLKKWPLLNDTCSSKIEGGCLEALFRLCPGMRARDIFGRTPDVPSVPKGDSGFNARRNRFREQNGLVSWTFRTGSEPMWKAVEKKIGRWGLLNNSTEKFTGFTEEELAEVKEVNKTSAKTVKMTETHHKRMQETWTKQQQKKELERQREQQSESESEDDEDDEEETAEEDDDCEDSEDYIEEVEGEEEE
ncbi:hypothetical protein G7Y79_00021g049730 [Physcia stellaris]|nr:hypothetical protein G7Y79_00021g049730 [Physcia stellaris]